MEKITLENLSFTYPGRTAPAISGINLTIGAGEMVVLCGKSGCGKTTFLRLLKPSLSPTGAMSGKVIFDGGNEEWSARREAAEVGFIMQNPDNQIVCDKVWHELSFGLENLGLKKSEIRARVAEAAAFFGLEDIFYKNVSELSGGQKQLLCLASVMLLEPSVLILDEPTSLLDPIAAHNFLERVAEINREFSTTVILSEHRLEEAMPLADRVLVLEEGRLLADCPPKEVGGILRQKKSPMLSALPTPMRVYYEAEAGGNAPLTVREGRNWLKKKRLNGELTSTVKKESQEKRTKKRVLFADDVWFRYERAAPDVLKGLSLTVYEGELYVLLGGNGAGKSTALSIISGIRRQYRGKVIVDPKKRISAIAQNPQSLFSQKTVREELEQMSAGNASSTEEKNRRAELAASFCGLEALLNFHPHDLSGGEQQRLALAMALLKEPDILILDEPTKGLDAEFKQRLAEKIRELKQNGVTVIMVSHDVEFAAKYADRCGLLFDGQIVSEAEPREFFTQKSFYTTAANRMAREITDGAVTEEDILSALGVSRKKSRADTSQKERERPPDIARKSENKKTESKEKKRGISALGIAFAICFALLFSVSEYFYIKTENAAAELLSIVFMGFFAASLMPRKIAAPSEKKPRERKKISIPSVIILLTVPITIFLGMKLFGDRKYYFIGILIILQTLAAFFAAFEGRHPPARELIVIGVFCAMTAAGRAVFAPFPQFKPMAAMVIISGVCFGAETGFLVGAVSAFLSNFYFGQGPWTPWQMLAFAVIGFFAGVIFNACDAKKTKIRLALFGFLATILIYGGIMNPASVLLYEDSPSMAMILTYYLMGLPFDAIHAVSTVLFLWITAEPMTEALARIRQKYGF